MLFGAGLTAGLLGQIAEAIGSDSLDDIAARRHVGAAVRGALPGRARASSRSTPSASRGSRSTSGPFGGAESGGAGLWIWSLAYLAAVGAVAVAAFARRDL